MKSNFFKIVLPAFALMLAITASLAFTPADSAEDLLEIDIAEYINPENVNNDCLPITEVSCQITGTVLCTFEIEKDNEELVDVDLFLRSSDCGIPLYVYVPE
ncbi:DUF6520 family protein [Flavivirga aquimarina]|uniref:DUF6520 family protein n=1 Tax=Flavivirga aquimarina TaxID=2027862 RepID=A0ABT8WAC4_9FLAO|nr:DUF6520 family protein [Flavivirga aquimarina]MDO5970016.1 DUF6520 family protein [Flavivirga aquimarina]